MYLLDNPVLQRELLDNLRMNRAFLLLFVYLGLLGTVVWLAWPHQRQLDMTSSAEAKDLVDLFFLGQYVLASLMAPSFAAGAITGEKERKTYESLLASPLRPSAIILGKLLAALCHLGLLIFCSLPIVMLCVPLGGVSLYEVLAAYLALVVSVICFGMISIACSSYFRRTVAALTVSYLIILPLALVGALFWSAMSGVGFLRLIISVTVYPAFAAILFSILYSTTARRLMHPPDVGSEGKEVVDIEEEMKQAVGMVIQSDQFPDSLFAPAKRNDLIPDGANPVYDKEMRSELFSQGTLMLRIVIQVSMFLAIPLMAFCFYIVPQWAPWYISYVVLFNVLLGPVFSAERITSERERETLELLLTTIITPWQILWGKLLSGLRVSTVLTTFVLWPVLLACAMVPVYWKNLPTMVAYLVIVLVCCLTTATVALFCSVLFRKTSISLMCAYMVIIVLFMLPPAAQYFINTFIVAPDLQAAVPQAESNEASMLEQSENDAQPDATETDDQREQSAVKDAEKNADMQRVENAKRISRVAYLASFTSPFSAAHSLPLKIEAEFQEDFAEETEQDKNWQLFALHIGFSLLLNSALFGAIVWLFNVRWRVTY